MEKAICIGLVFAGTLCILSGVSASANIITGCGVTLVLLGLFIGFRIPERLDRSSR